jgi:DNA (cytosine-5)-methyltransferase 1
MAVSLSQGALQLDYYDEIAQTNLVKQFVQKPYREPNSKVSSISKSAPFTVVSLFSGCGGMDLGFKGGFTSLGRSYAANPFKVEWANEINEAACRTYRKNVDKNIHQGDIWKMLDDLPKQADVVIGGFPCQDISVNGKGAGLAGKRSGLYRAMVEVVARTKPKVFVAENVKGLLMKHHSDALLQVLADFKALGYNVSYQLYVAADYGVAQTRERVIIVGTLPSIKQFKSPTPVCEKKDYITARDALHDLSMLAENESINHVWSKAQRSPDQGDRRLRADRPGYTIRAECHGNIQWHYEQPRRISMREAARIQSFPDDFIFDSKLRETERQVGNAVPPVLAWHIAQAIAALLK